MQLRWTEQAAADLERIADYLFEQVPERADKLVRTVYQAPATLPKIPQRGRPGRRVGTRELVLSPLPYLLVYTVRDESIIVRILHGAQQWP
jgi:addiction module RelE/StbE family toxin